LVGCESDHHCVIPAPPIRIRLALIIITSDKQISPPSHVFKIQIENLIQDKFPEQQR